MFLISLFGDSNTTDPTYFVESKYVYALMGFYILGYDDTFQCLRGNLILKSHYTDFFDNFLLRLGRGFLLFCQTSLPYLKLHRVHVFL